MSITCDASGQFCPDTSLINPCGNPRTLFEKKQLLFTYNTNANSVNDVSKKNIGFSTDQNEVLLLGRNHQKETFSLAPKTIIAKKILNAVCSSWLEKAH